MSLDKNILPKCILGKLIHRFNESICLFFAECLFVVLFGDIYFGFVNWCRVSRGGQRVLSTATLYYNIFVGVYIKKARRAFDKLIWLSLFTKTIALLSLVSINLPISSTRYPARLKRSMASVFNKIWLWAVRQ